MVDVRRSDHLPRDPLEQEQLLVGACARAEHPDRAGPILVSDLPKTARRLRDRLRNGDVTGLIVAAHHRSPDPLRAVPTVEAVAAAVAEPHVVDERVVARREAANLEVAAVDIDVAAV